jgi:UDP-N-acetylglucosamine 2-epimerase (non-hydrolysing)
MNTALENSVTFTTRRVGDSTPAGGAAGSGTVMHAVGSRAEVVRLASVVSALRTRGVPQILAWPTEPDVVAGDILDGDGVPRTEALVELLRQSDVRRTAEALAAAERALLEHRPSLVVLAGDSDSAFAFALAASKLGLPIVRLGAGLRCGDIAISDEINRVMSDRLANVLFTDGPEATDALEVEGIGADRVQHVGNTGIDLLRRLEGQAEEAAQWRRHGVPRSGYLLVSLHRPENVADGVRLGRIASALAAVAHELPVVMPLHPVARDVLAADGGVDRLREAGVLLTEPLRYLHFLSLALGAGAILTDSGSVQDEASALGVRCYTLRRATERLVSLTHGTNVLLGDDPAEILELRLDTTPPVAPAIPLWDGRAGDRIAADLVRRVNLEIAS